MPDPKADWMSFVLHFIFGLVVGALGGLFIITHEREIWLRGALILPFLSGAALLGGGLGAKLGDRLWMSGSYRMVEPDAPAHNRLSKWLCELSILVGIAIAGTTLFKQFHP